MKHFFLSAFSLATLAAQAADLDIVVSVPSQKQGTVLAALFDKAEAFPRGRPLQTAMAQPAEGKFVIKFANLPPGEYAVSAFLDENGNAKLDVNVFGVPTEVYGFSRNARGRMAPPSFADTALRVEGANLHHVIELK